MRFPLALLVLAACGGSGATPAVDGGVDAAPVPGWTAGPRLPEPLLEPGVVALGDEVWVIGGFDAGLEVVTHIWILGPGDTAWHAGPAAPDALTHMNLAVDGGKLYLLGGLVSRVLAPTGQSWVLSDDHTTWTSIAPFPSGKERGAAAVIAAPDRILVAGGASQTDALSSVMVYTPSTDTWSTASDLPTPRSHPMGALAPDGTPVVIGGLATLDASMPIADVVGLDPGGVWQPRAAMPTPRGGCSAAVIDNVFYCTGGEAGGDVVTDAAAYDLAADHWTTRRAEPTPRGGTGGAALAGTLIAPGGAHHYAWDPVDDVAVFDPSVP